MHSTRDEHGTAFVYVFFFVCVCVVVLPVVSPAQWLCFAFCSFSGSNFSVACRTGFCASYTDLLHFKNFTLTLPLSLFLLHPLLIIMLPERVCRCDRSCIELCLMIMSSKWANFTSSQSYFSSFTVTVLQSEISTPVIWSCSTYVSCAVICTWNTLQCNH